MVVVLLCLFGWLYIGDTRKAEKQSQLILENMLC
jgi:hypothetical protein